MKARLFGIAACVVLIAAAAPVNAVGTRTPPPVKARSPFDLWDLGDSPAGHGWFDPVNGRTFATGSEQEPNKAQGHTQQGEAVDGWDTRLAGNRRSRFYPPSRPTTGPGTVLPVAGGACDGMPGPQVAVDPATVKVDGAGRIFWIDNNDTAHLKGLPYVRMLGTDGRVRTLGNIGGPLEGRAYRDSGTASGMPRLIPDDRGGVYYSYLGYFSIGWDAWATEAADDVPIATVIGHLKPDGTSEFVSGAPLSEGQNNGYGSEGYASQGDGKPYAEAAFFYVDSMTTDREGSIYVVDGNIPAFNSTADGGDPNRRHVDPATPGGHNDSRPVTVRFLNRSGHPVTFYRGTAQEITVPAGQVQTIAGTRETDALPPVGGPNAAPQDARKSKLTFSSGIDVDAAGRIRLLQVGDGNVRILGINTGAAATTMNGTSVTPGTVAVLGGSTAGYGGDGQRAVDALFDVRDANHWFYGDLATAADGSVVLADTVNDRIRRIDPHGLVTTQATARYPMGVDVAPDGTVVFSDWGNAQIRAIGRDGRVRTVAGTGSPSMCGDGGRADRKGLLDGAGLVQPHDIARDSQGNVYIADVAVGVVRRISPDGGIATVVGRPFACPSGVPSNQGSPSCPPGTPSGDGGPPERATLEAPGFLLIDRYDNLYVSDGAQVRYVNFSDREITAHNVLVRPHTIGTVLQLAADLHRTEATSQLGGVVYTYYQLIGITGLALDKFGTLYVSDTKNNRVLSLTWCGDLGVVAGNGAAVSDAHSRSNGDGGPAIAASLTPAGLAWDELRGLLFVATLGESRVRVVNLRDKPAVLPDGVALPAGFIDTYAGGAACNGIGADTDGPANFRVPCSYGDGGPAREAAMVAPLDVEVAPGGRLFISDVAVNLIRVVERDGTIGTLAGITPDFFGGDVTNIFWALGGWCGDGGVAYRACFSGITGLALGHGGDLYVAEMQSGRVRRILGAVHAKLRPPVFDAPVRGAGWQFTAPLRLRDQQGDNALDPEVFFDSRGRAFVLAPHATHGGTAVACDLWRYDVDADGVGHDDYAFLGDPDAPLPVRLPSVPYIPAFTSGESCSLALSPPGGTVPVPPGTEDRISYLSQGTVAISVARTGTSRDGGRTFVSSPYGVASGATGLRSARIAATGPDDLVTAFCCVTITNNPPNQTLVFGRSSGGVEYVQTANMDAVISPVDQIPSERDFLGTPIVTAGAIYVPYYLNSCISASPTVCSNAFPSDSRLYVAKSTDGGLTWKRGPAVFSLPCTRATADGSRTIGWVRNAWCQGHHGMPQVVADAAGHLYAAWDDEQHVYLSTSPDGVQWSTPVQVDRGLSVASYPTLVAGSDGRVAVAFLGTTSPAKNAASRDAEYWVYLAVSLDARAALPTFTQSLASSHRVHSGVLCQASLGSGCFGGGNMVSEAGNFFRVALNPVDGHVVVAYVSDAGAAGAGQAAGVSVIRQCSGPALLRSVRSLPCAPDPVATPATAPVRVLCPAQGHDPRGDAPSPALDLTSFGLLRDGPSLQVRIGVAQWSTSLPTGATGMSWTGFWHSGRFDYYAQAVTPTASDSTLVSYSYGVVNDGGRLAQLGTATGRVDGDTLVLDVPADRVGDPRPGQQLTALHARTDLLTGAPPDLSSTLPTARSERADVLTTAIGYDAALACGGAGTTARASSPPPGAAWPSARGLGMPVVPLLPCTAALPPVPPRPPAPVVPPGGTTPHEPAPVPPHRPVVGMPVEPPLTPVGPAPGPAPAPQPGPAQQLQMQQQLGTQSQPGQQVGVAGALEAEHREARAFTASRRESGPPAAAYAWLWTMVAVGGGVAVRLAGRAGQVSRAGCRPGRPARAGVSAGSSR